MLKRRKTIGLALGSGGVKGIVHIGVIKTLEKHGIPIDYIAGSSVGAWVASHYALFQDVEELEEKTAGSRREKLSAFLDPTMRGGLIKGDKIQKLLDEWLCNASFSDTKIPVEIAATDLVRGTPVTIYKGKLAPAVRASMAIPAFFRPLEYQDKLLTDGGISNPIPDNLVREMGADIVISVNLDNYLNNENFTSEDLALTRTSSRCLNIMRHHLAQYSIQQSDIVINHCMPGKGLAGWKNYFSKETGRKMRGDLVRIGEEKTEKVIPRVKELLK